MTRTRVSPAGLLLLRIFFMSSSSSSTLLQESNEQCIDDILTEEANTCGRREVEVDWQAVFRPLPEEGSQTFEDLVAEMNDEESPEGPSHIVKLPRLQAQTLQDGLFHLSVDVDSVKGLFTLDSFMEAFHNGREQPDPPNFEIYTNVQGNHNLVTRGGSFTSPRNSGRVSIPKVPEPVYTSVPQCEGENELRWLVPSDSNQRWVSLSELKHVQLAKVRAGNMDAKIWWVFPNMTNIKLNGTGPPFTRQSRLSLSQKTTVQTVLSKAKTIAAGRTRQALNFVSRTTDESSSTLESLEASDYSAYEICNIIRKWQRHGESLKVCLTRVYKELTDAFIPKKPLPHHSSEHTARLSVAAFHALVSALPVAIILIEDDVVAAEVGYSLLYFDALGLKSQTAQFVEGPEVPRNIVDGVKNAIPKLAEASNHCCRVDMALEWQSSTVPETALFWPSGCVPGVLSTLPRNLKSRARMYPQFGLLTAVNIQAHNLYWVPGVPNHQVFTIPSGAGVTYLGKHVPVEELQYQSPEEIRALPQAVTLLNMYCPGPKRTSSTFNTWGMSFNSLAPYLAMHHLVPGMETAKADLQKVFLEALQAKQRFLEHINTCVEPWSLRLEIGSLSPEDSFESLLILRQQFGLDSHEIYDTIANHIRPVEFPLDLMKEYIVKHIGLWWREIEKSVASHRLSSYGFLQACWAEQAIQCCNFVLRGQPVWDYNTCVAFLRVASKAGYFCPRTILREAREVLRTEGNETSRVVRDVLRIHCKSWERETLLRLFAEFNWMKEKVELLQNSPGNEMHLIRQMALRIIRVFYADLHAHMYHKGKWTGVTPPLFLSLADVFEDPITFGNQHLKNEYGGTGSKVYPYKDKGGILIDTFLRRWFPLHGNAIIKCSRHMKYAVPHLWCATGTILSRKKFFDLQKTIGILFCDLRMWHLHERGVEIDLKAPLPLLVPDALSGQRVFHQLNHWRVVVGTSSYLPAVYHGPSATSPTGGASTQSSLAVLKEERIDKEIQSVKHQLKVQRFTDHETIVFVLFVFLEGGEDLILHNDFSARLDVQSAYRTEEKQVLYCYRVRRTVRQIYDKLNSAKKKQKQESNQAGFHLAKMRSILYTTLGNPPTQEKARRWLEAKQAQTLQDFRKAFHGERGPRLDDRNRLLWEHFRSCDAAAEHPCSTLLSPMPSDETPPLHCPTTLRNNAINVAQEDDLPAHQESSPSSIVVPGVGPVDNGEGYHEHQSSQVQMMEVPQEIPTLSGEVRTGDVPSDVGVSSPQVDSTSSGRLWRRYFTSWMPF